MIDVLRNIYNTIFRSSHRFKDGSGLYHLTRYDIIRYYSGDRLRRIADIPVIYDPATDLSRIDLDVSWRWRDPQVPLGDWSDSGPELVESERLELYQKLSLFLSKQSSRFEPLNVTRTRSTKAEQ